ncbi:putative 2OG-Fe(II) oxygenase family oxidoreductase [Polyplosphaeria fusca]|uniref:2OG-Fe(II) oxygenase family oxidoreductase n=1 Tax=Polyplosphaeria fusca TaxID=682080 RepID=A0A9P4QU80_9PLEO|nr:putative 2OG-Fe(II) oxygenase family oxidoreductase [Polyplosphaeria fusca]
MTQQGSITSTLSNGNRDINSVDLKVIPFARLEEGDEATIAALLEAGTQSGFFYLDLQHKTSQSLLNAVDDVYQLSKSLFDLTQNELITHDLDVIGPSKIDGYKPAGRNTGVARGKQDGFEIYLVSTNSTLKLDPLDQPPRPKIFDLHEALLSFIVEQLHRIGEIVLERFSSALQLPDPQSLQNAHRYGRPSTSALGLLKYPPASDIDIGKLGQIAHTDVGSITVLFSRLGGLQVLQPDGEWAFVEPKPGHAVINIGDSLRFLAGKKLLSSLHRVVPHPDAQTSARFSIAYFMRPEYEAEFEDEEGKVWTGIGWHTRKFAVFRASMETQIKDSILTGRTGYLGLLENF